MYQESSIKGFNDGMNFRAIVRSFKIIIILFKKEILLIINPMAHEYQLPWRRPVGSPTQSWMKTVENDLKKRGITYTQAEQLALDRKSWRSLVANRVLG